MAFERDVLEEVTQARAAYRASDPIPAQAATSEATTQAVRHLFAVVENYPELKSAENVTALQAEIARLEDVIADRRELYNDQVFRYNTRIQQLPANLLAAIARVAARAVLQGRATTSASDRPWTSAPAERLRAAAPARRPGRPARRAPSGVERARRCGDAPGSRTARRHRPCARARPLLSWLHRTRRVPNRPPTESGLDARWRLHRGRTWCDPAAATSGPSRVRHDRA